MLAEIIFKRAPALSNAISIHLKNYFWTGATYAEIQERDLGYVLNYILSYDNSNIPSVTINNSTPSLPEDKDKTLLMCLLTPLLEERREVLMRALYLVNNIFERLGYSYQIYANQAKWLTFKEWDDLLSGKKLDITTLTERMNASFISWHNGKRDWITGIDAWKKELEFRRDWFTASETTVYGDIVVSARIKAYAVVMIDADPISLQKARCLLRDKPLILITGMTTPELTPLLNYVVAVITDEGGITCHAATICREKKIPCLINTRLGTKVFSTGDQILLEENKATLISKVNNIQHLKNIDFTKKNSFVGLSKRSLGNPKIYSLDDPLLHRDKNIGYKAKRLSKLRELGFLAPQGIVLSSSNKIYWDKSYKNDLLKRIKLDFPNEKNFSVRSSATDEDGNNKSLAGLYSTLLFQSIENLDTAINEVCDDMYHHGASSLCVLIQPMLKVITSGVAFSPNLPNNRVDQILIEASPGAGGVVEGNHTPQRYICRRKTRKVERIDLGAIQEPTPSILPPKSFTSVEALIKPQNLYSLLLLIHKLEKVYSFSLDIEWAITEQNKLYILQVRPQVIRQ